MNVQVSYRMLAVLFAIAGLLHPEQRPVCNQFTRAETQHLQPGQVGGDSADTRVFEDNAGGQIQLFQTGRQQLSQWANVL